MPGLLQLIEVILARGIEELELAHVGLGDQREPVVFSGGSLSFRARLTPLAFGLRRRYGGYNFIDQSADRSQRRRLLRRD